MDNVSNRGFRYGDGLFETVRVEDGQAMLLSKHFDRLEQGCAALDISCPDLQWISQQIVTKATGKSGVARVFVTAESTSTDVGYFRGQSPAPALVEVAFESGLPTGAPDLVVLLCELRLAEQPALAGLKHRNRLEQILAGREVTSYGLDEGLVFDQDGRLVEAIHSNVLVLDDAGWHTPRLDRCGVAGVGLDWVRSQCQVTVESLSLSDVKQARSIALVNAVRGLQAVQTIEPLSCQYEVAPVHQLRKDLNFYA